MATNYTEHYELNQWEPTDQVLRTDFNADNAKLDAALTDLAETAALLEASVVKLGNCRVETMSYVGTGTYGAEAPNTLTFSARPKFLIIAGIRAIVFIWESGANTMVCSGAGNYDAGMSDLDVTWKGNQISYYGHHVIAQLNNNGSTYQVVAFYAEDEQSQ